MYNGKRLKLVDWWNTDDAVFFSGKDYFKYLYPKFDSKNLGKPIIYGTGGDFKRLDNFKSMWYELQDKDEGQ